MVPANLMHVPISTHNSMPGHGEQQQVVKYFPFIADFLFGVRTFELAKKNIEFHNLGPGSKAYLNLLLLNLNP